MTGTILPKSPDVTQRPLALLLVLSAMALPTLTSVRAEQISFQLRDVPGQYLDVLAGDKIVARYQYAYDPSTPESLHETYKPYLHVMDAAGEMPITKGAGGQFTHHRGIFIGWNKVEQDGKSYDRWHMKQGDIVHKQFENLQAGPGRAQFTSLTHWNKGPEDNGETLIREKRTMTFLPGTGPVRLVIDFASTLTPTGGTVRLNGDPEHAGVQFRPADEVDRKRTQYLFPREGMDPRKDQDPAWVGETFFLKGQPHSIVHVNHPRNPAGTLYSAYRDYGRFGAFFVTEIPEGESLTLRYRFLVIDGNLPDRELLGQLAEEFARKAD
ncbi:MAG: PmoA family protein [Planctomycetaceae bacterium]|nr:PmoA family protein [Planctomycetaceae bacterium]